MIELRQLTKRFGSKVAVDDLTLTVQPGELFAFLGPNAAGKTTTIKMLVGLLRPTLGTALISGVDIQRAPIEAKRSLSYVPDVPYLYEKLTGWEFMQFIAGIYDLDRAWFDPRAMELLEMFGLDAVRHQLVEDYSHGMRQKLVMSAALVRDPEVIIIDEPMVGLDPRSAKLFKDIMRERARAGCTIFMSTHTLSVAEDIADRIGIMNQGRLIAVGTLDELRKSSGDDTACLEEAFLQLTHETAEMAADMGAIIPPRQGR